MFVWRKERQVVWLSAGFFCLRTFAGVFGPCASFQPFYVIILSIHLYKACLFGRKAKNKNITHFCLFIWPPDGAALKSALNMRIF